MYSDMKYKIQQIVNKYKEDYAQEIKEVIGYMWDEIEPIVDEYEEKMDNSVSWCIDDIKHQARDAYGFEISDQNAQTVLEDIIHNHDASIGINWEVINEYVWQYKPGNEHADCTNEDLFNQLTGAHVISPDEKYEDWKDHRNRMIELLIQNEKV